MTIISNSVMGMVNNCSQTLNYTIMETMPTITINTEQQLYVITAGDGFSCLGFEVCEKRKAALSKELNIPLSGTTPGTIEAYNEYNTLIETVRSKNAINGFTSQTELTPEFMGHEGKRVEVIDCYGEKRRFYIGISTGVIPVHLEIKTKRSIGGQPVYGYPFKQWKFVK